MGSASYSAKCANKGNDFLYYILSVSDTHGEWCVLLGKGHQSTDWNAGIPLRLRFASEALLKDGAHGP